MNKKNQKGFTLIEAMIAVVVFSFGLLGVAGVMTVAVKNNHNGYMRSQAMFLASSMIDTMRRNQISVWNDDYIGTYSGNNDISSLCNSGVGCNPAELAERDVKSWANMIDQVLPNSSGEINCISGGSPSGAIPAMIPDPMNPGSEIPCIHCQIEPYKGVCNITITWTESNTSDASSVQTYVLPGKP